MKFLNLIIPAIITISIYFILYRPTITGDAALSQTKSIGMLHFHIVLWWGAFLYLVFCLMISFLNISRVKTLLVSGLGVAFCAIALGFVSGFIFAKQMWGVYYVWDTRFLVALLIFFFTFCLLIISLVVDEVGVFKNLLRLGLALVVCLFFTSHFLGFYVPAMHPNSVIHNILVQ